MYPGVCCCRGGDAVNGKFGAVVSLPIITVSYFLSVPQCEVVDTDHLAVCSCIGDPHCTTFDGQ